MLYTDDSTLAGPDLKWIEKAIEDIKASKLDIKIEGDIPDFLGININRKLDGTINLTQPNIIDQIFYDLKMGEYVTPKPTTAASSKLFSRH